MNTPITMQDVYQNRFDGMKYYVDNIFVNSDREAVITLYQYGSDGEQNGSRVCTVEDIDCLYKLI